MSRISSNIERSASILYTLFVVAIVVVLYLLAANHPIRFDMTDSGRYTLSAQTIKLVKSLKEDITMTAFVRPDQYSQTQNLLEQYGVLSDKIKISVYELDAKPGLAEKYNVTKYQSVIIENGKGRFEKSNHTDESSITKSLLKLLRNADKNIYFLEGHDERSIDDETAQGYFSARSALEGESYKVTALNWFKSGKIPKKKGVLIIAGPRKDFAPNEIALLKEWVDSGRAILFMLDPGDYPELEKFAKNFGISYNNDRVLDPVSQQLGFDPLISAVADYGDHPIVEEIRAATFFPVARSMRIEKETKNKIVPIAKTAVQSFGETDFDSIANGKPVFDENSDNPGPLTLIASVEKNKSGKMIFSGDSDFAGNGSLSLSANKDLFLNMTAWLSQNASEISIRPKQKRFEPILWTDGELTFLFVSSVVVLPLLTICIGIFIFLKRRRG
jgi:ABC-type uncharacterized transport system involved in gliding motility auxiliary subunit